MVLSVPDTKCFGRGCKPRPAMAILQTPSGNGRPQWFCQSPAASRPQWFCQSPTPNVSDGVANPVRQWPSAMVLSVPGSKCFGRGCKPRPAMAVHNGSVSPRQQMFRTGLQTPSGNGNLANPVRQWPSAMVLSVPGSNTGSLNPL